VVWLDSHIPISASLCRPICCRLGWQFGGVVLEKTILIAEARGDEIVVRTLGFYAAYEKPTDAPQLVLKRRTETDDRELLARA
jgi:hypothetical protein